MATIIVVIGGRLACYFLKCASDVVLSVRAPPFELLGFPLLTGLSNLDAESRIEQYELILSGEIKIPNKKEYSPESRDLLLEVSFSTQSHAFEQR